MKELFVMIALKFLNKSYFIC